MMRKLDNSYLKPKIKQFYEISLVLVIVIVASNTYFIAA